MAIEVDHLIQPTPASHAAADISINHLQLRNLLLCPGDSSTLYTVHHRHILQHKLTPSGGMKIDQENSDGVTSTITEITKLPFEPVCLAVAPANSSQTLLASGGQNAELHLSLHSHNFEHRVWEYHLHIKKASINNSVLVIPGRGRFRGGGVRDTDPGIGDKWKSSGNTMSVLVSNNDRTVKFYEVDLAGASSASAPSTTANSTSRQDSPPASQSSRSQTRRSRSRRANVQEISDHDIGDFVRKYAEIKLDSAVNFTTSNPDYTTLVSVTDSNQIYIHAIDGYPAPFPVLLKMLSLPPYSSPTLRSVSGNSINIYALHPFLRDTGPQASFATHFSADGTKFAVGSQAGTVSVWDVRSDKPIWTYTTTPRSDHEPPHTQSSSVSSPTSNPESPLTPPPSNPYPNRPSSAAHSPAYWYPDQDYHHLTSYIYGPSRMKIAPGYGIRCLKFGRGAASDLLVFAEHTKKVHVVDIRTFEYHQILEVPTPLPQRAPPVIPSSSPSNHTSPPSLMTTPMSPTSSLSRATATRRPRRHSAILVGLPGVMSQSQSSAQSRDQSSELEQIPHSGTVAQSAATTARIHRHTHVISNEDDVDVSVQVIGPDPAGSGMGWRGFPPVTVLPPVHIPSPARSRQATPSAGETNNDISWSRARSQSPRRRSATSPQPILIDLAEERHSVGVNTTADHAGNGEGAVLIWHDDENISSPGGSGIRMEDIDVDVEDTGDGVLRVGRPRRRGRNAPTMDEVGGDAILWDYSPDEGITVVSSPRPMSTTPTESIMHNDGMTPTKEAALVPSAIDIAGLTFSPNGESLFVATTRSIVEWKITDLGRARAEYGAREFARGDEDWDDMSDDDYLARDIEMQWR